MKRWSSRFNRFLVPFGGEFYQLALASHEVMIPSSFFSESLGSLSTD